LSHVSVLRIRDRYKHSGGAGCDRTARVICFRFRDHLQRVQQGLRLLVLQFPDFFHRGKILRHFPRIEERLDKIGAPGQSVADLFERYDLLGKWIFVLLQRVPIGLRLGIGIITHHLHQIGVKLLVKLECGSGVFLTRLGRVQKVVPETKRRPIHVFAF